MLFYCHQLDKGTIKEIQDWGQLPDNHKCKGRNWYHQFPMVPYTMGTVTNTPNN